MFPWIVAGAAFCMSFLYVCSLSPGKPRFDKLIPFERVMIAHRGFFDDALGIPENSLPAYSRAVERGFGIELDVQITTDGKLVCFHDETLKRMCGEKVVLTSLSYDELMRYRLKDTDEKIPLFEDALEIFRGRVPVIIEIKAHGDYIKTAEKLMTYMDGYEGDFCVESFHPSLVRWLRKHRPGIIRGQLSTRFKPKKGVPWIARFIGTNLLTNFLARPDFIAYDFHYAKQFSYSLMRRLYRTCNAAWTIKSREDKEQALKTAPFSIFIFDGYDPTDGEGPESDREE